VNSSDVPQKRDIRIPFLGVLFIVLGLTLLLDRLDIIDLRWGKTVWLLVSIYGATLIAQAFVNRRRSHLLWGNLLFFFGGCIALWQWRIIPSEDFYFLPLMCLAVGFSCLTTYIYEPRNVALLIPAVVFVGFGVVFYLWWWEYLDWFDMRYYARRYWPMLLIAWGLALVLRRRSS
jgi:hypothetical protein